MYILLTAGDDFHGPYKKVKNDRCFGGYIVVNSKKMKKILYKQLEKEDFMLLQDLKY